MLTVDQTTEVRVVMNLIHQIQVEAEDEKNIGNNLPLVLIIDRYMSMIKDSYMHFIEFYSRSNDRIEELEERLYDSGRYHIEEN